MWIYYDWINSDYFDYDFMWWFLFLYTHCVIWSGTYISYVYDILVLGLLSIVFSNYYWYYYDLLVICNVNCRFDKFHHYMNMTRKTVLKLAMSSTFFTSNNTLSIRACVTSTEIIMYTFQFRKQLWVNIKC